MNKKHHTRLCSASCLLILSAVFNSALASPVSVSFEAFFWGKEIDWNDTITREITQWGVANCRLVVGAQNSDPCLYYSRQGARTSGGDFEYWAELLSNRDFGGIHAGTAVSGHRYESTIESSDSTFLLNATSLVYVEVDFPLEMLELRPIEYWELPRAASSLVTYWIEFVVNETVLYTGSQPLTDDLLDLADPSTFLAFYIPVGNLYQSGSILAPGTYHFWTGDIEQPNLGGAPHVYATAELGERLYVEDSLEYQFAFAVIPIPAAVWLFGSGLVLLGWLRRGPVLIPGDKT